MSSPPLASVVLFFSLLLCFLPWSASQNSVLSRGSSLSVEDADVLISPDKGFSCGFRSVGSNAFAFSIWFTASSNWTTVWTANRDRPVNGRGSRLTLRRDGTLVLTDADKSVVWSTNTSSTGAETAELLETGNLVVKHAGGDVLWQSFGSPTHTLLPTQPMTKTTKLVSSMSQGTLSPGYYTFYFDNDNVLKLMYDGPEVSSLYWPNPDFDIFGNGRTKYNSSRYAVLDETGRFSSSDQLHFNASDAGHGIKRRLTLDPDGNLRLYSLNEWTGRWQVSWEAMAQVCTVHGQCGRNGICVWTPGPKCSCLPGHEMTDPRDWKKGCRRKVEITCGSPGPWRFVEIPHTDFYGYDSVSYSTNISFDSCKKKCEEDCSCQAFVYRRLGKGDCYPKNLLFNGYTSPNYPGSTYLKLPQSAEASKSSSPSVSEIVCNSTGAEPITDPSGDLYGSRKGTTIWIYLCGFVSAFGLIEVLFIATGWLFVHGRQQSQRSIEEGYRMISTHFRKFTYRELKRATGNFKHEVGRGGAGAVYKGVLEDKRVVAVKKLDNVMQGAEEFQAEISLMGRIYHMNLVRVWGFCSEGTHRLLVSEYLEKGSLAQVLFDNGDEAAPLDWGKRYKIALGTARGLAYLHHECLEWIVHCDVKPENILLDGDFDPKIADFGLAKLSQRGVASAGLHFSRIRGTKGYMAPEWIMNFPITAKVDVYSYGVVLLEIAMGRRISTAVVAAGEKEEVAELRQLVRRVKEKIGDGEGDSWVEGFVDPRLGVQFSQKQAAVMLEMAASCLEDDKNKRPSMDFVAETLLSCDTES